jgi:hypothetical protein
MAENSNKTGQVARDMQEQLERQFSIAALPFRQLEEKLYLPDGILLPREMDDFCVSYVTGRPGNGLLSRKLASFMRVYPSITLNQCK